MTKEKFNEIIDYAINEEKKAAKFYRELQDVVKFAAQKKLLKEYELMEEGHATVLEEIKRKGVEKIKVQKTKDLHLSDYLVDVAPSASMNYQDILLLATKKEAAAYEMYKDLSEKYSGTEVEDIFRKLAAEELDHKYMFEKMYDDDILIQN